jgi:hypothetical protein
LCFGLGCRSLNLDGGALIMSPEKLMKIMDTKGFENFVELEHAVEALRAPYEVLFNYTDNFHTRYPALDPQ